MLPFLNVSPKQRSVIDQANIALQRVMGFSGWELAAGGLTHHDSLCCGRSDERPLSKMGHGATGNQEDAVRGAEAKRCLAKKSVGLQGFNDGHHALRHGAAPRWTTCLRR